MLATVPPEVQILLILASVVAIAWGYRKSVLYAKALDAMSPTEQEDHRSRDAW